MHNYAYKLSMSIMNAIYRGTIRVSSFGCPQYGEAYNSDLLKIWYLRKT